MSRRKQVEFTIGREQGLGVPGRILRNAWLLLVCSISLVSRGTLGATPLEHWKTVCDDFRDHYSYTEHKGVDWSEVYERNKPRFEVPQSAAQFATNLHESLLVLHDWHVAVQKPDGGWLGYSVPVPRNYPAQVATNHAATIYVNYHAAGALVHARLTNDAVHLIVPTLDSAAFEKLRDNDLDELFGSFAGARGVIFDLRYNSGGNELHARRLAAFFVREPTLYGYTRTRSPTEPDGFTPMTARHVVPNAGRHLDMPVVVLTGARCLSSCEWLVLMLREAPNAILMGGRTRGGTGNPDLVSIPELGVKYLRSRWMGYTPEGELIEDRGIQPTIGLRSEWSYDDANRRDLLLEQAMAYVDWRHRVGNSNSPVHGRTDTDADGVPDVGEFVAGMNPNDAASVPRLRVTGPSIGLAWVSAARRAYWIQEASAPTGPWVDLPGTPFHFPLSSASVPASGSDQSGRFFRLAIELAP